MYYIAIETPISLLYLVAVGAIIRYFVAFTIFTFSSIQLNCLNAM